LDKCELLMVGNNVIRNIQKIEPMTESIKAVIIDICNHKPTPRELENLVHLIEQELELKTTSKYAKHHSISFNGAKNNRHHFLFCGIKIHYDGYTKNKLPF